MWLIPTKINHGLWSRHNITLTNSQSEAKGIVYHNAWARPLGSALQGILSIGNNNTWGTWEGDAQGSRECVSADPLSLSPSDESGGLGNRSKLWKPAPFYESKMNLEANAFLRQDCGSSYLSFGSYLNLYNITEKVKVPQWEPWKKNGLEMQNRTTLQVFI